MFYSVCICPVHMGTGTFFDPPWIFYLFIFKSASHMHLPFLNYQNSLKQKMYVL